MISLIDEFAQTLAQHRLRLDRLPPETLQLNVGKLCNLTCVHCHVNAGPHRKEIITSETVDRVLAWFSQTEIPTLDLTGGSPEMVPDFRRLVRTVRQFPQRRRILDRLNATLLSEPGYGWLAEFLAENEIEIIASMPCYSAENVNEQRGDGVFDRSIAAFQQLNQLGYGHRAELPLHLVYNPNGAFLPGEQSKLQADYKLALRENFGIEFNDLYTITNMPISRFAAQLKHEGQFQTYHELLRTAFNPTTIAGLMCRTTLNVSWQGEVFDCDFNQMLRMGLSGAQGPLHLWEVDPATLLHLPIRTGNHCFGCTAGCGSSCGGALVGAI